MPDRPAPLLGPDDPEPVEVAGPPGASLVIACDHAGRLLPASLAARGPGAEAMARHVSHDIGAREIALRLAERLGAAAVLGRYSRLAADLNRYPHDPGFALAESDGHAVSFNEGLSPPALWARLEALHRPYHDALARALDAAGPRPTLVSVHTMTDRLRGGEHRPWHHAVLHAGDGGDGGLAGRMLRWLGRHGGGPVGDNVPYALDGGIDFTVPEHAQARGLPFLMFEVRQDLVATPEAARAQADLLAQGIAACLAPERGQRHA